MVMSVFVAARPFSYLRVRVTLSPHHLTIPLYNFDLVPNSLDTACMYISLRVSLSNVSLLFPSKLRAFISRTPQLDFLEEPYHSSLLPPLPFNLLSWWPRSALSFSFADPLLWPLWPLLFSLSPLLYSSFSSEVINLISFPSSPCRIRLCLELTRIYLRTA